MAKKFVKVNGLHNVFEASANIASSTIKSGASASVDANSILFITADADDEEIFGGSYPSMKEGAHYIWAQGVLHDTNSGVVKVGITGDAWIDLSKSQMTPQGPSFVINHVSGSTGKSAGINSGNTTADAGGESIQFKVPKLTFDNAGHIATASDVTYKVSLPKESHTSTDHKTLTVKINGGTTTYNTRNDVTLDIDTAINNKIAPFENAMHFIGKATVDLTDGATTGATALGITGYTAADKGDIVLDKSGIHEYIWTGSAWEQIGYLVGATAANVTGSTYEIGKITVEGKTTTFVGKDTVTTVSYADTSKSGSTYEIGKITINGTTTTLIGRDNDTKYTLPTASTSAIGGIKIAKDNSSYTVAAATSSISANVTSGKYYGVEIDKNDKAFVYVPWTNNHSFKSGTGIALSGTTTTSAGELTIGLKAATSSAIGGIAIGYSENGKNYPVELNSSGQAYVNVPWTDSNTTYGASGGVELNSTNNTFRAALHSWDVFGATGVASTTANRYYRVGLDAAGKLAVNVPWTDTNTAHAHAAGDGIVLTGDTNGGTGTSTTTIGVTAATTDKYGGIKIGYAENGKNYPVELNSSGQAFVNVPWQNNTYTVNDGKLTLQIAGATITTHSANTASNTTFNIPVASSSDYGVIKTGFTEVNNVKKYAVKLDSNNKAYVEVPWTNTNTTYTLSGAVVGTTGSAAANSSVTTAVASAVSFVDTLKPSSGSATVSTCILMNGDGSINLKTVSGKNNAIEIDYTGVATAEDWATIG